MGRSLAGGVPCLGTSHCVCQALKATSALKGRCYPWRSQTSSYETLHLYLPVKTTTIPRWMPWTAILLIYSQYDFPENSPGYRPIQG